MLTPEIVVPKRGVMVSVPAVPVVQVPPTISSYIFPALGSLALIGVSAVGISTVSDVAVIVVKSAFNGSFSVSPKYCLLIASSLDADLTHKVVDNQLD